MKPKCSTIYIYTQKTKTTFDLAVFVLYAQEVTLLVFR